MSCVYTTPAGLCDGTQPLSKNEHYFSRVLGNFKDNEPLVDRICDGCQKVCSRLEDVLAHNSPEAFFREMIGRVGRTKHNRKNIFYDPTFGIPRSESTENIQAMTSSFFGNGSPRRVALQ